ncbi:MAG: hypothetical protein CVU88_00270 [Firmicutes bacterium HGW-Firmicutes-13]|nr:MAG: hypothetical protein CVU88_00270 [Firmicutes bacterium HGW-Firmicutes-13]
MFVIIAGCGEAGARLSNSLAEMKYNIVIIDREQSSFEKLNQEFNGITILGNAIDIDIQRKAGIEDADIFIAVTGDNNANLMAAQIAKRIFKVNNVIARFNGHQVETVYERQGIKIIYPIILETRHIIDLINNKFSNQCLCWQLSGIKICKSFFSSKAVKKKVGEIQIPGHFTINIIFRQGEAIIPQQKTVILDGDSAVISLKEDSVHEVSKWFNDLKEEKLECVSP